MGTNIRTLGQSKNERGQRHENIEENRENRDRRTGHWEIKINSTKALV